ncbi:hypothetical protein EE612_012560 [Oryza sativa]|nr:hypothetical protein EE612_012560 [Oryza sativa]
MRQARRTARAAASSRRWTQRRTRPSWRGRWSTPPCLAQRRPATSRCTSSPRTRHRRPPASGACRTCSSCTSATKGPPMPRSMHRRARRTAPPLRGATGAAASMSSQSPEPWTFLYTRATKPAAAAVMDHLATLAARRGRRWAAARDAEVEA